MARIGETDVDAPWDELGRRIGEERGCGIVRLGVMPRAAGLMVSDALADSARLGGFLGPPQREIARAEAEAIVLDILQRDLAYCAECIPHEAARKFVEQFASAFAQDARFFTNGNLAGPSSRDSAGWTPITPATFDTGVFAVDANTVGYLWVEDED